jgi:hypothetical protein
LFHADGRAEGETDGETGQSLYSLFAVFRTRLKILFPYRAENTVQTMYFHNVKELVFHRDIVAVII